MNRRQCLLSLSCLTLVILGCGDSPYAITRDGITAMNELADAASKIPDDESAEDVAASLYKTQFEPLKDKFEAIRKRKEVMDKRVVGSKKEAMELVEPAGELEPESEATARRLTGYFGPGGKIAQIRNKMLQLEQSRTGQRVEDPDKHFPGLTACMRADTSVLPSDTGSIGYIKLLREAQKAERGGARP